MTACLTCIRREATVTDCRGRCRQTCLVEMLPADGLPGVVTIGDVSYMVYRHNRDSYTLTRFLSQGGGAVDVEAWDARQVQCSCRDWRTHGTDRRHCAHLQAVLQVQAALEE